MSQQSQQIRQVQRDPKGDLERGEMGPKEPLAVGGESKLGGAGLMGVALADPVKDARLRLEDAAEAGVAEAISQIDIVEVRAVVLWEPADLLECASPIEG
jgi:hypothetical protein